MKNRLKAVFNILRNRPTIYGVDFEECKLYAFKNDGLILFNSRNVHLSTFSYPGKIKQDGSMPVDKDVE